MVEQADLGRHHHPAFVTLDARLERVHGEVVDAQSLELERDPFLHFVVQEWHARPFGQSHPP